jgi:hypothetical protein
VKNNIKNLQTNEQVVYANLILICRN